LKRVFLFRLAEYRPAHFSDECDKETNSSGLVPEYRVSLSADKAGLLRGSLFLISEYPAFSCIVGREARAGMNEARNEAFPAKQEPLLCPFCLVGI